VWIKHTDEVYAQGQSKGGFFHVTMQSDVVRIGAGTTVQPLQYIGQALSGGGKGKGKERERAPLASAIILRRVDKAERALSQAKKSKRGFSDKHTRMARYLANVKETPYDGKTSVRQYLLSVTGQRSWERVEEVDPEIAGIPDEICVAVDRALLTELREQQDSLERELKRRGGTGIPRVMNYRSFVPRLEKKSIAYGDCNTQSIREYLVEDVFEVPSLERMYVHYPESRDILARLQQDFGHLGGERPDGAGPSAGVDIKPPPPARARTPEPPSAPSVGRALPRPPTAPPGASQFRLPRRPPVLLPAIPERSPPADLASRDPSPEEGEIREAKYGPVIRRRPWDIEESTLEDPVEYPKVVYPVERPRSRHARPIAEPKVGTLAKLWKAVHPKPPAESSSSKASDANRLKATNEGIQDALRAARGRNRDQSNRPDDVAAGYAKRYDEMLARAVANPYGGGSVKNYLVSLDPYVTSWSAFQRFFWELKDVPDRVNPQRE
jgi:hypothetical protein